MQLLPPMWLLMPLHLLSWLVLHIARWMQWFRWLLVLLVHLKCIDQLNEFSCYSGVIVMLHLLHGLHGLHGLLWLWHVLQLISCCWCFGHQLLLLLLQN